MIAGLSMGTHSFAGIHQNKPKPIIRNRGNYPKVAVNGIMAYVSFVQDLEIIILQQKKTKSSKSNADFSTEKNRPSKDVKVFLHLLIKLRKFQENGNFLVC